MLGPLGQYSFLIAGLVAAAGIAFWLRDVKRLSRSLKVAAWLVLCSVLVAVWLAVRPTTSPGVETLADADRLIGTGKPAVLEFYSEY